MDIANVHYMFQSDVLNGLGLAYLSLNERLYVEAAGHPLGELFEIEPSELIGRPLSDLLFDDDYRAVKEALRYGARPAQGGPVLQAKAITAKRPGGGAFPVEITVASLPPIPGDERRLKQVMINLIGNAVKFTPQGGSIIVEAKAVLDGRLMVRVVDSGIGIAERDIPRALTPFTQVDSVVAWGKTH